MILSILMEKKINKQVLLVSVVFIFKCKSHQENTSSKYAGLFFSEITTILQYVPLI